MKYPVYCIRDVKVGFDPQFIIQVNELAAIRGFEYLMTNKDSMQGRFPSDYELYQLGEFDTDSGLFESITPKFIVSGGSFNAK